MCEDEFNRKSEIIQQFLESQAIVDIRRIHINIKNNPPYHKCGNRLTIGLHFLRFVGPVVQLPNRNYWHKNLRCHAQ